MVPAARAGVNVLATGFVNASSGPRASCRLTSRAVPALPHAATFDEVYAQFRASDALATDIQGFVKTWLAAHEYPREVAFIGAMPMTTTGKVIRRLLREQA